MRCHRLVPGLAALLLASTLVACSDDEERPDQTWLEPALLTVDDLGDAFEVAPEEPQDDESDIEFGCLFDVEFGPQLGPEDEDDEDDGLEAEFRAIEEPQMPMVMHSVIDSGDGELAADVLQELSDQTEDCTSVDTTDADGMRWQFAVEHDEETWAPGSDQQLTITATGTGGQAAIELPLSLAMTIVRHDDVLSVVMFMDMSDDITDTHHALVDAAAARLNALADDEPLPDRVPLLEDYPVGEALKGLLGDTSTGPQVA